MWEKIWPKNKKKTDKTKRATGGLEIKADINFNIIKETQHLNDKIENSGRELKAILKTTKKL